MKDEMMVEFERRVGRFAHHLLVAYRSESESGRRSKLNHSLGMLAQEVRAFGPERPSADDETTDPMERLHRLLVAAARQLVAKEIEARWSLVDEIDPVLAGLVNRSSPPKAPTE